MKKKHILFLLLVLLGIWVSYDAWQKIKVINERSEQQRKLEHVKF